MDWYTLATLNIRTIPDVTSPKLGQLVAGSKVELDTALAPVIAGNYVWRAIAGGGWCAESSIDGRYRFLTIRNGYPLTIYLPFPSMGIAIDSTIPNEVLMIWQSEQQPDGSSIELDWLISLNPALVQYTL